MAAQQRIPASEYVPHSRRRVRLVETGRAVGESNPGLGTGIVFVLTHSWLLSQTMIVPWNTIATQFTLLAGIAIVIEIVDAAAVLHLAILAGVTYIIRPIDAVAFAPLLVFATMRLPSWRLRIGRGLVGLAIIGAAVGGIGGLNLLLLGQWRTAYEIVSTETIGFFSYPVSYKLYWLLVDGGPLFGETDAALVFRYPWLFLSVPGLIFLVQQEKAAGAAVVAAIGINVALYLNYNDLLPSDIYRFTLIHYLAWTFPLVFLLVVAACWRIWTSRWMQFGFGVSLALLVVSIGLRLEPVNSKLTLAPGDSFALPSAPSVTRRISRRANGKYPSPANRRQTVGRVFGVPGALRSVESQAAAWYEDGGNESPGCTWCWFRDRAGVRAV